MAAKKKSVTMTDVAAHAGVSVKTVSNVINDWPYVTDETRQRVVEAIEVVGYRPNQMASSLVTGKTLSIGVVIPDISNPFFGASIRGCEDVLFEAGYSLFLCNTNENEKRERYYLEQLLSRGVDALILWGTRICCEDLEGIVGSEIALVTVELGEQPTGPEPHLHQRRQPQRRTHRSRTPDRGGTPANRPSLRPAKPHHQRAAPPRLRTGAHGGGHRARAGAGRGGFPDDPGGLPRRYGRDREGAP